jgi:membrane-associated protein
VYADLALLSWLSPDNLINNYGLIGLVAIIFAECGLLLGFFLPGDTLLFTAGVLVKTGTLDHSLWYVILITFIAAVAGNLVGYGIGRRAGPAVFRRPDSRWFRPEYVERTAAFFERWGKWAIVLARFVPIVRTFVTVMAGASRMNYRTFAIFSIIGGALWTTSVTCLGYAFGNVALIADHVELILLAGVATSVIPVGWHYWRTRPGAQST